MEQTENKGKEFREFANYAQNKLEEILSDKLNTSIRQKAIESFGLKMEEAVYVKDLSEEKEVEDEEICPKCGKEMDKDGKCPDCKDKKVVAEDDDEKDEDSDDEDKKEDDEEESEEESDDKDEDSEDDSEKEDESEDDEEKDEDDKE